MRIRYIVSLGAASLILSTTAAGADYDQKLKVPEVKADAKAQKDAECKMKQSKEPAEKMQKQQMKKAEQVQKEAGKGSEKGQAMREEHSKKWWKFWGEKQPEPVK